MNTQPNCKQSTKSENRRAPGLWQIVTRALLFCLALAAILTSRGLAQGDLAYAWAGAVFDQFILLPQDDYRRYEGDVLAFTYWQGGSSFIGEDPEKEMHIQAITRYDHKNVPYFFLSRNGNPWTLGTDHPGELIVVRMGNESPNGEALGETCNEITGDKCKPYLQNKTVKNIIFTDELVLSDEYGRKIGWRHVGGMQVYNHYLLVALEKTCDTEKDSGYPEDEKYQYKCIGDEVDRGAIAIFDLQNIDSCPQDVNGKSCLPLVNLITRYWISSSGHKLPADLPTMGAIGITYNPSTGRYVFVHSAGNMDHWEFLSSEIPPEGLEGSLTLDWMGSDDIDEKYIQTANFVRSADDGTLYLVGTGNDKEGDAQDRAYLYEVEGGTSLSRMAILHMYLENDNGLDLGNFGAAGGVYLSPSGRLILYSGAYDNDGYDFSGSCTNPAHTELCKAYQFGEFVSVFDGPPTLAINDQVGESSTEKLFALGSFIDNLEYRYDPVSEQMKYAGCTSFTTSIDWGDGTPVTRLPINLPLPVYPANPFSPPIPIEARHSYATAGIFTGTVKLQDCFGFLAQKSFTANISNINNEPEFNPGDDVQWYEDYYMDYNFSWATSISAGPPDESNQTLNFVVTNDNPGLFFSQPDINEATGFLSFGLRTNANGIANVTVELHDDGGTENGGDDTYGPVVFTITILPVNDPPNFSNSGTVKVEINSGAHNALWATNISAGPPDESDQTLDFTVTNSNSGLFSVQPDINDSTGFLTFTPATDASGSATATVYLRDNGGGNDTKGPVTFAIIIGDFTPPVVTVPDNMVAEATGPAGATVIFDPPPTATDNIGGNLTPICDPVSGSTFPIATTTVTCSATDAAGNTGSASFTVTVRDTTKPETILDAKPPSFTNDTSAIFEFHGTDNITPDAEISFRCYVDNGPAWFVCASPLSMTNLAEGRHRIWIAAVDKAGNWDYPQTAYHGWTVDLTDPVFSSQANITVEAVGPAGRVVFFTVSATDAVNPLHPAVTCSPASGSTFPLGTTTVNCSATDTAGNSASTSFTITVQDTTPPTITTQGNMVVEAASAAGSVVTFNILAYDKVAPKYPSFTCVPASGATFPLGTTTVDCTATDDAGNVGTGTFTVTVVDTTPPVLSLPADITTLPTGPTGAVMDFTVTASDPVDASVDIACTPPSGSTFPIATTTVNCTATDDYGNSASSSFTVTVGGTRLEATFRSVGAYDGTLRESTEFSGVSNFGDARGYLITVGDDLYRRQYMSFLDFDTSTLPDGAAITEVILQIKVSYLSAGLYTALGDMFAEVTNPYFGLLPNLQTPDFAAPALANAGTFSRAAAGNQWVTLNMDPASLFAVNPTGRTQFRLRFQLDDSNDLLKHYIRMFSGNYLNIAYRPLLTVVYYVP